MKIINIIRLRVHIFLWLKIGFFKKSTKKIIDENDLPRFQDAPYFLPRNEKSDPRLLDDHIPKAATLKRGLILICQRWQEVAEQYAQDYGWISDSQQETILR